MERITRFRAVLLLLVFFTVLGVFSARMYSMQVLGTGSVVDNSSTYTSEIRVRAARGDILDSNGNILVGNRASYNMVFNNYVLLSSDSPNDSLVRLVRLCREQDIEYEDHFPITSSRPYEYTLDQYSSSWQDYFQRYLSDLDIDSDISANRLMQELLERYRIPDDWTDDEARAVIGLRFELALRSDITNLPSYEFIVDVSNEDMTAILELNTPGLTAEVSTVREYYTKFAAHVLGTVGQIDSENWPEYKDKGYSMDAYVGTSGLEEAFEEELHGTDGLLRRTVDKSGNIISEYYVKEPVAGQHVEVSLDLKLQEAAENSMATMFTELRENNGLDGEGNGADVEGGAVVVIEVKTGKILVCASYPTYDLTDYLDNYQYYADMEFNPFINRALQSTYPPGSTFKVAVATAGLKNGVISSTTEIVDKGIFTKYEENGPTCMVYHTAVGSHGSCNVVKGLAVSCNYFFYEVGDRLGIEAIDEVAKGYGLGEPTGVELYEEIGHRANPETKMNLLDSDWYAGDTVLASIGQSENEFTPMQLCVYAATVANQGTRYQATFLNRVVSSDYSTLVREGTPKVMSTMEISDDIYETLKEGMHSVTSMGSAYRFFHDWNNPNDLKVCGKTGTAEHGSGGSNNGSFICFAPYDDPEIAIAVYGEKSGAGGNMSEIAMDVLDEYFGRQSASDVITYENRIG